MKNKIFLKILYFLVYFALFFVLKYANISGQIYPFCFAMLFALAWAEQKVYLLAPAYILANLCTDFGFENIVCSVSCTLVLALVYCVHLLCKKRVKKYEIFLFCLLSKTVGIVFDVLAGRAIIFVSLELLVGLLFLWVCMVLFEDVLRRKYAIKFTNAELCFVLAIVCAIFSGLAEFDFCEFSLFKFFATLIILFFASSGLNLYLFFVASSMAFGYLLATQNPLYFAPLVLFALFAFACRPLKKCMPLCVVGVEFLCGYYFNLYYNYTYVSSLCVALACALFMFVPTAILSKFFGLFEASKSRVVLKNIISRNCDFVRRRLLALSATFLDIDQTYQKLVLPSASGKALLSMLANTTKTEICSICVNRGKCFKYYAEKTVESLESLFSKALAKGKVTVLDVPSHLASVCSSVPAIITFVNDLAKKQKKFVNLKAGLDGSKLVVAEQMRGVSVVLSSLAQDLSVDIVYDVSAEKAIRDALSYANILCYDVLVYGKDINLLRVCIVCDVGTKNKLQIEQIVSTVCKTKMQIKEITAIDVPNFESINLENAPLLDCVFGVAQVCKSGNQICGDTYSVVRLTADKFMFCICDGMGSGEKANATAENAINLVEDFYKAGFESETIISTANKLLAISGDENFSALDICVVDLKNASADFIKMATPVSVVQSKKRVQVFRSECLPLGADLKTNPFKSKCVIEASDIIYLLSDGVFECFKTEDGLLDFIKTQKSHNPQELAEAIVNMALKQNEGFAPDDLTCLVIKTF